MCCARAAWVGKTFSMLLLPCANRACRASLAVWWGHVLLYMTTTNRSKTRHCSWETVSSGDDRTGKISVPSGFDFHTWKAVFFPFPAMYETVSHPMTAWKKGRAAHYCWVREAVILWMGRYLKWLPTPKAIHNSCNSSCFAYAIASTTTSVSTVLIETFLRPLTDACFTWMKILVSAS